MFNPAGGQRIRVIELHNAALRPSISAGLILPRASILHFPPEPSFRRRLSAVVRGPATDNFCRLRSTHYGRQAPIVHYRSYTGALNNDGESITLKSAAGKGSISFTYGNGRGWPWQRRCRPFAHSGRASAHARSERSISIIREAGAPARISRARLERRIRPEAWHGSQRDRDAHRLF